MIQRVRLNSIANPGASGVAILYSDAGATSDESVNRARVEIDLLADQVVTINTYWASSSSSPLRLVASDAQTASSHSTQPITAVAKASLTNNDYFTVVHTFTLDGVATITTVIYEFEVVSAGYVPTAGRTTLDVTGATSATDVAIIMAAKIAIDFAGKVSVPVPTTAVMTASAVTVGPRYTVTATENVANAGFTIGAATNGTETVNKKTYRLRPGVNKITGVTTTAPVDWSCAVETSSDPVSDA